MARWRYSGPLTVKACFFVQSGMSTSIWLLVSWLEFFRNTRNQQIFGLCILPSYARLGRSQLSWLSLKIDCHSCRALPNPIYESEVLPGERVSREHLIPQSEVLSPFEREEPTLGAVILAEEAEALVSEWWVFVEQIRDSEPQP